MHLTSGFYGTTLCTLGSTDITSSILGTMCFIDNNNNNNNNNNINNKTNTITSDKAFKQK